LIYEKISFFFSLAALKMEARHSCETLVTTSINTRRHNVSLQRRYKTDGLRGRKVQRDPHCTKADRSPMTRVCKGTVSAMSEKYHDIFFSFGKATVLGRYSSHRAVGCYLSVQVATSTVTVAYFAHPVSIPNQSQ